MAVSALPRVLHPLALASLLALSLPLAGCLGGGTGTAQAPEGATATTGILRGLVVDEAIRPVAGAHVNVTSSGATLNATTGDDGLFRFVGLQPGTYVVEATKRFHSGHQQAVVVQAGIDEPELVRFQLVLEQGLVPFAQVYKHDGYHECGSNVMRVCSNINIATWIVVCGQTGGQVCLGNVTNDRSVFFQHIDANPAFLQAELAWEATSPAGTDLSFLIGGGTEEELKGGVGLPAYNYTSGPSPLMVRLTNHEGEGAWCRNVPDPPCGERALEESSIGSTRALLGQVDAGPTFKAAPCGQVDPCGAGWSMQQQFTLYTTVFYGYEPPLDWLFTATGAPPQPPE